MLLADLEVLADHAFLKDLLLAVSLHDSKFENENDSQYTLEENAASSGVLR